MEMNRDCFTVSLLFGRISHDTAKHFNLKDSHLGHQLEIEVVGVVWIHLILKRDCRNCLIFPRIGEQNLIVAG